MDQELYEQDVIRLRTRRLTLTDLFVVVLMTTVTAVAISLMLI